MTKLDLLRKYTELQACDEGIWFKPDTISEAYLIQEMRRLVYMIEEASDEEIMEAIKKRELCVNTA